MPGFCTSEPYGFTDLSTDITMFDQGVSKALVVVKDFRVSEMSMDGDSPNGERSSTDADPADTTSVVRWNYALDIMTPENVSQVVSKHPPQDRLVEVLRSQIPTLSFEIFDSVANTINSFSA